MVDFLLVRPGTGGVPTDLHSEKDAKRVFLVRVKLRAH